ncbi:hypothetical protein BDV98DRAFT_568889 [Pterulicium gracile]|uniref:Uncharacterized protein n=1 Tax=Pterulicium gracile TaxID=1884261 RepID=A0A5C3QFM8_9AGAR|nr:hypothetical protein BDV98DRAFT_568889 [Pterula gracilis]
MFYDELRRACERQAIQVADPSSLDVKREVEEALNNLPHGHRGGFSHQRSYQDAPNPGLTIADLGIIGLPVGSSEAQCIKSRGWR